MNPTLETLAIELKRQEATKESLQASILFGGESAIIHGPVDLAAFAEVVIEECTNCIPTNWSDHLLVGSGAARRPLDNRGVEKLLRGIQGRIRALGAKL